MTRTPESLREEIGIKERPKEISIPEEVEKKDAPSVKTVPSTFTASVQDDKGREVFETPENKKIVITLPKTVEQLETGSKGKIVDAFTGFSKYWLRRIKKAKIFGWVINQNN